MNRLNTEALEAHGRQHTSQGFPVATKRIHQDTQGDGHDRQARQPRFGQVGYNSLPYKSGVAIFRLLELYLTQVLTRTSITVYKLHVPYFANAFPIRAHVIWSRQVFLKTAVPTTTPRILLLPCATHSSGDTAFTVLQGTTLPISYAPLWF